MYIAGLAGEDACRDLREVAKAREFAVVDVLRILVIGQDLVGNARHEGMRDDHALLVHDEDVGDHRFAQASHSPSPNGTNRPSLITV